MHHIRHSVKFIVADNVLLLCNHISKALIWFIIFTLNVHSLLFIIAHHLYCTVNWQSRSKSCVIKYFRLSTFPKYHEPSYVKQIFSLFVFILFKSSSLPFVVSNKISVSSAYIIVVIGNSFILTVKSTIFICRDHTLL